MAILIRPHLVNRPICATVRVDRDTIRSSEPETRIFARVARSSFGDLWTVHYSHGLPVSVTLIDSRRRLHISHNPGDTALTVTPDHMDPRERPDHFPPTPPPDETPVILSGIRCFYRKWTAYPTTTEQWHSYDYASDFRIVLFREGYGTTTWYLDEVRIEEPPAVLFDISSVNASEREHEQNLMSILDKVFQKMSENPPIA